MFLAVLLIALSAIAPVGAVESVKVNPESKIDSVLKEKMETASPDEKIPVAIWYEDVDQNQIDILTENEVGVKKEEIEQSYEMPSAELLSSLENGVVGAENEMQAYLQRTEKHREKERKLSDDYIMTRREFSRKKYKEKSTDVVNVINLSETNISFKSQYAPMLVAQLNRMQIEEICEHKVIETVYYSPTQSMDNLLIADVVTNGQTRDDIRSNEPNVNYETQIDIIKQTISYDKLTDKLITSTDSNNEIMVGVIETGGQINADNELNDVSVYHVGDDTYATEHITEVAKRIAGSVSGFSTGVALCSTNSSYANMESMLNFRDIQDNFVKVINISYAVYYVNGTIAYMAFDRWINHVVAQHNISVVVAANNQGAGNGAVSSPGLAHNVITVGAYHPGPDYLTFTYNKDDDRMAQSSSYNNGSCVSKPDVVMPGGSTSYATPMLTGSIAMMLHLKPSLALYPQAVKAIILASCHRKVLSYTGEVEETMFQGITDKQGAGAPDVWVMARIVSEGTYGVGRIRGNSTIGIRRFVMPNNGATNINISLTWLKEDTYTESADHTIKENVSVDEIDVDLNLSVYRNNILLEPKNLTNSTTEMVYYELDSNNIDYRICVNKATTEYTGVVRYGYAYSTDASYMTPITQEGIYFIRNYYNDKYLTLNTITNEAVMENFTGNDNQKWIIREETNGYEIYPAYGSVSGKINFGEQVGTNPYYKATLGFEELHLDIKSWETDTTLEPDSFVFTSTSGGSNNILSYTYTNGIFVRSTTESIINSYRMWVLEDINFRRGDVNMDGILSIQDCSYLQQFLACYEGVELNNQQMFLADANRNNQVSLADVTYIEKIIANLVLY